MQTRRMTTKPAIELVGLTKSYGDLRVLTGVDLCVPTGTIVAVLGSNGAGKTPVVKILSTLLHEDGGTAAVNGYDVATEAAKGARVDLRADERASVRGADGPLAIDVPACVSNTPGWSSGWGATPSPSR